MQDKAASGAIRERLPLGIKLQYAMGGMVEGVVNNALPTFLLFYVTTVMGLPGAMAGAAIAVGTIVDAVLDPIIGSSTDNLRSRLGRRLPFMLVGLPIVAITLFLTFGLPQGWPDGWLFAWLTALSIILRTSLSLYGIPYQAVAAELTEDYGERSSIMAYRWGAGLISGLATVAIGFNLFFSGETGLSDRSAYMPFGATIAVLVIIAGLIGSRAVFRTLDRQYEPASDSGHGGAKILGEVREVFKNGSFRSLAAAGLLLLSALAVHGGLAIHAGKYFWQLAPSQLQILPLVTLIGLVLGTPFAAPLTKKFGKKPVALVGFGALFIVYFVPPLLRIAGLLPLENAGLVLMLSINAMIVGALMSCAVIAVTSMLADATDEHEHIFGARREGMFFAAWLFAGKAAAGFGALAAGFILQSIDLPTGTAAQTQTVISPQTMFEFGLYYGLVPGLLSLGSVISLLFFRLDAKRHSEILADLHERRGEGNQVPAPA